MNLVIVDTCDCCTETKKVFGNLQGIVTYMRVRKRTATFVQCKKDVFPTDRIQGIKAFCNTRWTSHDQVINVICEIFKALLKSLNILKDSCDRITASNTNIFKNIISSFSFVLILLFFKKKIFLVTIPLSNYLQSKSLDFIDALRLVNYAKTQLENFRCDEEYEKIVTESNQFSLAHDLHENNFKERRTRKKKRMVDENTEDEVLNSAFINYKINTYFNVLDNIVISFTTRFNSAQEILKDLSLLSPERLIEFANDKEQKLQLQL